MPSHIRMSITAQPMALYMGITIFMLWLASLFGFSSVWLFGLAFLFLFEVERIYTKGLRWEIRSEERRSAYQSRPLSDFESAEWLNQAVEKLWQPYLQKYFSEDILTPMVPWFLERHKPWTVRNATLQRLDLGKSAPRFWGARTLVRTSGDDDLVMDFCLDYTAAEDMTAVLSVQMRRRLGLGIKTNIHVSRLHIEGKVRVAIKLLKSWPGISRISLCFETAPYVQMTARPLSTHGVNVSELPLIAGWMERMVADVFEQSLVEPNMIVVDIEKIINRITTVKTPGSSREDKWFHIEEKPPIAVLHLKVLEASDLKPSDPNGLADPFVKGSFATHRFRTKVLKKTLSPRWFEEFDVPIASWELPTILVLHVRDKDQFRDDDLGYCEIDIKEFRGGQDHDLWLTLRNIKVGRLHIAVNIAEYGNHSGRQNDNFQLADQSKSGNNDVDDGKPHQHVPLERYPSNGQPHKDMNETKNNKPVVEDRFEVINLGKGCEGFVSIVSPGQQLRTKSWQQRQGTTRPVDLQNHKVITDSMHTAALESSSSEEGSEEEGKKTKPRRRRFWGKSHQPTQLDTPANANLSPAKNNEYVAVGTTGTTVRMKLEKPSESLNAGAHLNDEPENAPPTPHSSNSVLGNQSPSKKHHMKSMAKGFMKHAGKTAHNFGEALTRKGSRKSKTDKDDASSTTPDSVEDVMEMGQNSGNPVVGSGVADEKGSERRPSDGTISNSEFSSSTRSDAQLSDEKASELSLSAETRREPRLSAETMDPLDNRKSPNDNSLVHD